MSDSTRLALIVTAVVIVAGGALLRLLRDRHTRSRVATERPVAVDSAAVPGTARQLYLRKVRPIPEENPPSISISPQVVEWFEGGNAQPVWRAAPNDVSIEYKPASTFGVNMPTAAITGPGKKSVRGRLTADPRPPMGGFDVQLEESMARELLDVVAFARSCGVRIANTDAVPTRAEVEGERLTKLTGKG